MQGPSAFHPVAVEVAQQQAQLKVHGATSGRVQAIAISPTVDGVPMQQLRPTTHEGPRQLLPPAAQGPPRRAVQLVGAWTAGHMAKAVACKLAAAKAILGPHLEMEPGPACRIGGKEGWVWPSLLLLETPGPVFPHQVSAPASSLDSHPYRAARGIFLSPCSLPTQNPAMIPQCTLYKVQPQRSRPLRSGLC